MCGNIEQSANMFPELSCVIIYYAVKQEVKPKLHPDNIVSSRQIFHCKTKLVGKKIY